MANIKAIKDGNFNDPLVWSGGVVPGAGDTAFSNSFAITITDSATLVAVTTAANVGAGAVDGGWFYLNADITLTADVVAGNVFCLYFGGSVGQVGYVTGNVTGGSGDSAYGAYNQSTGSLSITGNATGGSGSSAHGALNGSTGSLSITGNVTGGSGSSAYGALNQSTGSISITGNATGGSGSSAWGAYNDSTSTVIVGIARGNDYGAGVSGVNPNPGVVAGTNSFNTFVGGIEYGPLGQSPTQGVIFITPSVTNTAKFVTSAGVAKTLSDPLGSPGFPASVDVRLGVDYAIGNATGSLAVPAPSSVAFNVPTDNTVGTAVLTPDAVQAAVDLTGIATTQNVADSTQAIESAISNVPATDLSGLALATDVTTSEGVVTTAIGNIPTVDLTGIATIAKQDEIIADILSTGNGTNIVTITVNDGTTVLQGASVTVSEGINSFTRTTDANGVATFSLKSLDYGLAVSKDGYDSEPDTITVDAAHLTFTESMTQRTIPAPVHGGTSIVYLYTRTEAGVIDGIAVNLRLQAVAPYSFGGGYECSWDQTKTSGQLDSEFPLITTPVTGLIQFILYPGEPYSIYSSDGRINKSFTAPPADTAVNLDSL